jgi:hypothetical protein
MQPGSNQDEDSRPSLRMLTLETHEIAFIHYKVP